MGKYLNKKVFYKDLKAIFKETRLFIIANLFISLAFITFLLLIDIEYLDYLRRTFVVSLEIFIAVVYILLQFTVFFLLVLNKYRSDRKSIEALLREEESRKLEFKSSLRWDYQQNKPNKSLEHNIIKAVAGFSNTDGGTLLIGVSDNKEILGLENDYATLKRKDKDGFVQHLSRILVNSLGNNIMHQISIDIIVVRGKDICRIDIISNKDPVFVSYNGSDEFYIRTANITIPLSIKEAYKYIEQKKG